MYYAIRVSEDGVNIDIDEFETKKEAQQMVKVYENMDRAQDCYIPNHYKVVQMEEEDDRK